MISSFVDLQHNRLVVHARTIICDHTDPELVFVQDQSLRTIVSHWTKLSEFISVLIVKNNGTNGTNTRTITQTRTFIKLDLGDSSIVRNNLFFVWFAIFILITKYWSLVSVLEEELQTPKTMDTILTPHNLFELECERISIEFIFNVELLWKVDCVVLVLVVPDVVSLEGFDGDLVMD